MLKKRKHMVTLTCMVVGILVLSSAVYANYDDAKGYSNYKEALKRLVFEETNFTAEMDVDLTIDGTSINKMRSEMKLRDGDNSSYNLSTDSRDSNEWESYTYQVGDKFYGYYPDTNQYYEYSRTSKNKTMIPLDDATSKKAVRFMELLADTMVGDLKNNVVLDSIDENGVRNYSLNIEGNQIPEVVNAGLSLMFSASAESFGDYATDNNVYALYANDAKISQAKCTVSLDEEGRLVANYLEASLTGTDAQGKTHKATMVVDAKVSDYGKTVPDVFDPTGKKLVETNAEAYTVEATEE